MTISLKQPCLFALVYLQITVASVQAEQTSDQPPSKPSFTDRVMQELDDTWQAKDYEWYIPINTWHNRSSYSREQISEYNERPWGIGVGKYRYDLEGNWHGLYTMAFLDSNSDWEPVAGYAFQKTWHINESLRLGLGYTAGITFRHEIGYIPIPVILPLISIKYQSIGLQSTYIPGTKGNGNVLFTWLRWEMP